MHPSPGDHGQNWSPDRAAGIRGDQQAATLVAGGDQLEQCRGFRLILADVAEVVEDNEVVFVEFSMVAGAVADVVGMLGGVVSDLFNES